MESGIERISFNQRKLPRGIRNNNPGNIRLGESWEGLAAAPRDDEFCTFESMEYGIRAMAKILITYRDIHGLRTPRQVLSRWAPPEDGNNTEAYIRHVKTLIPGNLWCLDAEGAVAAYVRAISMHENGYNWNEYWMPHVSAGVKMALE